MVVERTRREEAAVLIVRGSRRRSRWRRLGSSTWRRKEEATGRTRSESPSGEGGAWDDERFRWGWKHDTLVGPKIGIFSV